MKAGRLIGIFLAGVLLGGGAFFLFSPSSPPVLAVLGALTGKSFTLREVIRGTSGTEIFPLNHNNEAHRELEKAIRQAAGEVSLEMSGADSPARLKSRINEVSSLFEDALREKINAHPDFSCASPKTKAGEFQRSGYPDLRIEHLPSETVAYLDPKLFKDNSLKSSFRTFYFEPGGENSKVTEDALHLLIGFPHDGKTGQWTFGKAKLIDLSTLEVTLKTEFSASNKDVYHPVKEASEH